MSQWWENAEAGRAGRYGDPADLDDRPTRAECEADEREIAALRKHPTTEPTRDLLAELVASVQAAKAAK